MSMTLRIYRRLRELGWTYHQARACFRYRLDGGLKKHGKAIGRQYAKEVEAVAPLIQQVKAVSFSRRIPKEIGIGILDLCWPDRDEPPLIPYSAIREALIEIWDNLDSTSDAERQQLWHYPLKILRWEEKSGVEMWDERMMETYFLMNGEALN